MEVIEVLKYFAKFPDKQAVLDNFVSKRTDSPTYQYLTDYINNLPNGLLSDLKGFVFSSQENELKDRIRNMDNYFMFVEYGSIKGDGPDKVNIRKVNFDLAIYVCFHSDKRNRDDIERAIEMDNCLNMLLQVINQMIADGKETCPHQRFLQSSLTIAPVEPYMLYQAYGWCLSVAKSNDVMITGQPIT